MAGANRRRILRLPCRANQQHGVTCVSIPCRCALAPATVPAQPEGVCGVGADGETGGRIPPKAPYPSPLAKCAVCRQTPEVGAECGNPARSDLCGGTGVTRFPTANADAYPRIFQCSASCASPVRIAAVSLQWPFICRYAGSGVTE